MKYGHDVIAALTVCWTVLGMPAGKRLAPMLGELVAVLRHFGELAIDEDTAALLVSMSAATVDRRLAGERAKYRLRGGGHQAGITAQKPDPGAHLGRVGRRCARVPPDRPGLPRRRQQRLGACFTSTPPTSPPAGPRPLKPDRTAKHIWPRSITGRARSRSPSPASTPTTAAEFINHPPPPAGATPARSPHPWLGPATKTTKPPRRAEELVGGTSPTSATSATTAAAELLLLNEIWQLQSKLTNYFYPQQKLISKVRTGAKVSKKHDKADHPVSPRDRSPDHDRGAHRGADPDLLADQSRRHPAPDPSPDRPAPHTHHQQSRTQRHSPKSTSAHVHVRQRIRLRAHLDMRQHGPRPPRYGPEVIAALTVCWTVLGMPAGKRLAPMLAELVAVLRHFGELVIDEDTAALLVSMSAATIDRRLAGERAQASAQGTLRTLSRDRCSRVRSRCAPGPTGTTRRPGFVEIDLVSHDGGNLTGQHAFTLTVTDIATGWTENRSVPSKAATCVFARAEGHRREDAVPDSWGGLRQRIGVHQHPLARMV